MKITKDSKAYDIIHAWHSLFFDYALELHKIGELTTLGTKDAYTAVKNNEKAYKSALQYQNEFLYILSMFNETAITEIKTLFESTQFASQVNKEGETKEIVFSLFAKITIS